jgi:hypothetical protein
MKLAATALRWVLASVFLFLFLRWYCWGLLVGRFRVRSLRRRVLTLLWCRLCRLRLLLRPLRALWLCGRRAVMLPSQGK